MRNSPGKFRSANLVTGLVILWLLCSIFFERPQQLNAFAQSEPFTSIHEGISLDQELTKDSTKTFQIQLTAQRYVSILFNKGDLQLSASVSGPGGESITEQISKSYEPVRLSFISRTDGT